MIDHIEGSTPTVYRNDASKYDLPATVEPINTTFRIASTRGSFKASLLEKFALSYDSKKRLSTGLTALLFRKRENRAHKSSRTYIDVGLQRKMLFTVQHSQP